MPRSSSRALCRNLADHDRRSRRKINSLPKHVASTTLTETTWNAEMLVGDAVAAVAQLKESGDGTLVKCGNGPFSRALLEAGLLDELYCPLLSRVNYGSISGSPALIGHRESAMQDSLETPGHQRSISMTM